MNDLPRLLITMGDVAGVGPEIIAKAWPELVRFCAPVVVGDPGWMLRGLQFVPETSEVRLIKQPEDRAVSTRAISVLHGSRENLKNVQPGQVSAAAGKAAYDFLCAAIDLTLHGKADAIVTAPLHKEGLHQAGLNYPGHTEILAERTGTREYGMMLFARTSQVPHGLGVVHVTLHCALRDVFWQLSAEAVEQKIRLLHELLTKIQKRTPRLGVCGLNPHASDGGLFGDEEEEFIAPAVQSAQAHGIDVSGPWPSDTLFIRARAGDFDGIVAMYHDQGHVPMKLLAGFQTVNITIGLPIIRTSVAHGTAYDIAGKGLADPASLIEAARVAASLCGSLSQRHKDAKLQSQD